ncbi:right-handed parallel beta-helix repeat-containing protein [Halobaculum sp. EA56]|uniref:right-handed parallel beta-helix repeat-containing protein n=1 Tax=Halobaculum sp. EA56 TaxID=3421648 RepID=UPI003EBF89DC
MAAPITTVATAGTIGVERQTESVATDTGVDRSVEPTGDEGSTANAAYVDIAPSQLPGSGTPEDPYIITNASELQAIADDRDATYRLGSDIDASETATWNGGKGFDPIGRYDASVNPSDEFTGTLDGANHTISNLYINRTSVTGVGLFAVTNQSVVKNLHLADVTVTGRNNVGAVSGSAFGGTVANVTVTGTVSGDRFVGGVVGQNQGTIRHVYSEATVTASDYAAGIAATNLWSSGLIDGAVAVGRVQSPETAGGVVASQNNKATIGDAYWDVNATGQPTSAGSAVGLTTVEMTGESATETMSGLDFQDSWRTRPGDYPLLAFWADDTPSDGEDGSARVDVDPADLPGSGTADDPYELSNASELQAMADAPGATYELTADIDASATASWNNGAGFAPVGNASTPFTGQLLGNGHAVHGLTVNRSSTDNVGLFGFTDGATVTDLRLVNVSIRGGSNTGAIAGYSRATTFTNDTSTGTVSGGLSTGGLVGYLEEGSVVTNSTAEGSVSGSYDVGGVVGSLRESTVRTSFATSEVSGEQYLGGLVGNAGLSSRIERTYALGTVEGDGNLGGLVGFVDDSNVSNSYAAATVRGNYSVGGLLGANRGGLVTDSYWDTDASGAADSAGGTGLTTAEMTGGAARSNMSGLAFGDVWQARPGGYPTLTPEGTETPSQPGNTISQCQVINESGTYYLGSNITTDFSDQCIQVAASDVVFDGQGHTIDGVSVDNTDKAVFIGGYNVDVSNVTVRNVRATNTDYGIRVVRASNVTVEGVTTFGTEDNGVYVQGSSDVELTDVAVRETSNGFSILSSSDVTVRAATVALVDTGVKGYGDTESLRVVDSKIVRVTTGISLSPYAYGNAPSGTTIEDTVIRDVEVGLSLDSRGDTTPANDTVVRTSEITNVGEWTVYTENDGRVSLDSVLVFSEPIVVFNETDVQRTDSDIPPTRVLTGTTQSVAFRVWNPEGVADPPLPGPFTPIVETNNTTGPGTLALTVGDLSENTTIANESLRLYSLEPDSWEPYPGDVTRDGRTLNATVTNETTVAVLAESVDGGDGGGGGGAPSDALIAPFAETTALNDSQTAGLPAGVIRAEEPYAGNVSVELLRASATNYSLAITAPDSAENVTFYIQEQAVTASQNVTDLVMYLDGERQRFVVNESAGPGNSPWIAFNVPHFSTRTVTFTGESEPLVVDDDGTANYTSIQNAVDNASAGDTVRVEPGTYTEQVVVDKNITLVAPDGATIDGPESDTFGTAGIQIAPDSVAGPVSPEIRGFTIDGFDTGVFAGGSGDGDLVGDYGDVASGDWVLRNVTVTDSGAEGIAVGDAVGDWRIADSEVHNTTYEGINADGATGTWVIEDSVVADTGRDGIRTVNANGPWTVRNVTVRSASGEGIDAGFTTSDWVVRDVTLANNDVGISAAATSGNWTVTDSRIRNNTGDGISLSLGDEGVDPVSGNWTVSESVIANNGAAGLDARNVASAGNATRNWWGASDGPSGAFGGSGDEVVGDAANVTVRPYYVDAELTTLSSASTAATVRVASGSAAVDGAVTVPVVLSNASAGLSGYNITVTVANGSVATIVNASVDGDFALNDTAVAADGTEATLTAADLDERVQSGATDVTLATVTLRGTAPGTTTVSVTVNQIDDDEGTSVPTTVETGAVTVRELPAVGTNPAPTDPDGDGRFEDLNGNGRVDFDDVVVLFRNLANPAVTDNVDAYDFNDNGRIDYNDIVTLFGEL